MGRAVRVDLVSLHPHPVASMAKHLCPFFVGHLSSSDTIFPIKPFAERFYEKYRTTLNTFALGVVKKEGGCLSHGSRTEKENQSRITHVKISFSRITKINK